jgi:hypothetical protein
LLDEGAALICICVWYDRPNGIVHGHGDLLAARNHQHLLTDDDTGQGLAHVLDELPAI